MHKNVASNSAIMRQLNFASLVAEGNFGQTPSKGYLQHILAIIYVHYGSVNNAIYTHVSVDCS